MRFHDGHELTSADVVYTFRSLSIPAFVSPRKGAYRYAESVEARDRYTVVFQLKEPFGSFPVNLVMPQSCRTAPARRSPTIPSAPGPIGSCAMSVDDRVELAPFDGLLRRRAAKRRPRVQGDPRRHHARASSCARARWTSSSTTWRPTSCISSSRIRGCRRSSAGRGLSVRRAQPARSDPEGRARPPGARATRSIARRSSSICAAAGGTRPSGMLPPRLVGVRARRCQPSTTIRRRRGRCSTRPAIRIRTATAPRTRLHLTLKISEHSSSTGCRRRSSSRTCARSASTLDVRTLRVRDAVRRRAEAATSSCTRCSGSAARRPIPTSCGGCSIRTRCRPPASTADISGRSRGRAARRGGADNRRRRRGAGCSATRSEPSRSRPRTSAFGRRSTTSSASERSTACASRRSRTIGSSRTSRAVPRRRTLP